MHGKNLKLISMAIKIREFIFFGRILCSFKAR